MDCLLLSHSFWILLRIFFFHSRAAIGTKHIIYFRLVIFRLVCFWEWGSMNVSLDLGHFTFNEKLAHHIIREREQLQPCLSFIGFWVPASVPLPTGSCLDLSLSQRFWLGSTFCCSDKKQQQFSAWISPWLNPLIILSPCEWEVCFLLNNSYPSPWIFFLAPSLPLLVCVVLVSPMRYSSETERARKIEVILCLGSLSPNFQIFMSIFTHQCHVVNVMEISARSLGGNLYTNPPFSALPPTQSSCNSCVF